MESQTPTQEGTAVPTPPAGMSPNDSAQVQADPSMEATPAVKPAELRVIEESLGREFSSVEEAKQSLKNLNSLVGDQTVSKQRKALEKLASQANLTPDELIEVIEAQAQNPTEEVQTPEVAKTIQADPTAARLTRIEVNSLISSTPEAAAVKDQLFAEALKTGKTVEEIWASKFYPVFEAGKKTGAKKLQTTLEGQPLKATSAATEQSDTKVDFSGINPQTGKRWTAQEMEKYVGYTSPSTRL